MNTKQRITLLALSLIILCIALPSISMAQENRAHNKYFLLGVQYADEGKLDEAIESFKKVLYVDRNHARSAIALARAYERQGKLKNAVKEYRYLLSILPADASLTEAERQAMHDDARQRIEVLAKERKQSPARYTGSLNIIEHNILLLALMIICFYVVKALLTLKALIRAKMAQHEESKIWLDRYWVRRKEKEVSRLPLSISQSILTVITVIIFIAAGRLIVVYGFKQCFSSLWQSLTSIF